MIPLCRTCAIAGRAYCPHRPSLREQAENLKSKDVLRSIGMEDTLAFHGGAVKALGGGKVGGYLVLFSTSQDPDLQGDYFTKSTDFFVNDGDQRPILYRHGLHPVIKSRKLGRGQIRIDDVGVFLNGELDLRDDYEKAIYKLAEMGKLGWSSGSMGHLVSKTPKNKSFEVESWPIGEASLTPNPVEGRTSAMPLKSFGVEEINLDDFVKSLEEVREPFETSGIPAINTYCEDVSARSFKDASQRSESAAAAAKEFIAIADIYGEAIRSDTSRLVRHTENRFVKDGRQVSTPDTLYVQDRLRDLGTIYESLDAVKAELVAIQNLSEVSKTQQKAMDESARFEMWNFLRISGTKPEELRDGS